MSLELKQDEVIEKEFKSDYWDSLFGVIQTSQTRGHYTLTNERIFFSGGFATEIEIPYNQIESISKCNVGGLIRFVPTGIKVTMKDGKKHFLSVTNRNQIMELIQSKIG